MRLKMQVRAVLAVACAAASLAALPARAAEVPVVNGEQWTTSNEAVKKAYLVGLANLAQVEAAYYGKNPPSDAQSFVPRLVKGMQGKTLDGVRGSIDGWYAAHPGDLKRPVLDVIWFEIAMPGMQSSK